VPREFSHTHPIIPADAKLQVPASSLMHGDMSFYSMSGFLEAVTKVGKFSLRWDDDFFDRVNHRYTVMILVVFTVVSSSAYLLALHNH